MATGSQWDLTQLVAWGRMFTGYAQELTLSAAAEKTFSGEMCHLCKVVQNGKREQSAAGDKTAAKAFGKILDLAPLTRKVEVRAPEMKPEKTLAAALPLSGRDRATPPSPPPRA
jgi:hypothetical protein